jgi:signal transduction histidine kinase
MARPRGWASEVAVGIPRSVILVGLTGLWPLIGAATLFFGSRFTTSWSDHLVAGPWVVLVAALGEWTLAGWWTVVVAWLEVFLLARPLTQATRSVLRAWTGVEYPVRYHPPVVLTEMANGYWWNGYEYEKRRWQAGFGAWQRTRRSNPQWRRDFAWLVVSALTVFPVAAALPAGVVTSVVLAFRGSLGWAAVALVAGTACASLAWRVAAALGPHLLVVPERATDERVQALLTTQAYLTKTQAAELERIERGLHDGAQARLVALGLELGAAERLVDTDPEAAKALLRQTRASSSAALAELRALVRGINPPILTERGVVEAVRALALESPIQVDVLGGLPGRPERPIEAAVYFAVAELLTNVAKHARATLATVEFEYTGGTLRVTVMDNGVGGAAGSEGSGLQAMERRLAAFGGGLTIQSPAGGGTRVAVAVPCALS